MKIILNKIFIFCTILLLSPNIMFGVNILKEVLKKISDNENNREYKFLLVDYKKYENDILKSDLQDTILLKKNIVDTVLNYQVLLRGEKAICKYINGTLQIFFKKDQKYNTINCNKENIKLNQFSNYFKYLITKDGLNTADYLIQNINMLETIVIGDTICLKKKNYVETLQLTLDQYFYIFNDEIIKIQEEYFYMADSIKDKHTYDFKHLRKYNFGYQLEIDSIKIDIDELDLKTKKLVKDSNIKEENIELKLRDKFINKEFYTNSIKNLNGQDVKIENNGKHKIIFFWGSWCGACKLAFKPLKEFIDSNDKKFEVIAISVKEPNDTNQLKYITGKDFPFTFLKNGDLTADYYGLTSYPSFVILNKDFKIEDFAIGYFDNFKDYLQYIKNELK